jgi:hypothetical protein
MAGSVCLVTVHGIGFQRAANDRAHVAGYADQLHTHLREFLGTDLGDDPQRSDGGPVYVSSEWKGSPAEGLARLDAGKPLAQAGKIAHVALVYSPSEGLAPHLGETAGALARAAASHRQYANAIGIVRLLLSDAWAALHENDQGDSRSSLIPRGHVGHRGLCRTAEISLLMTGRHLLPGRLGSSLPSRTTSQPTSLATSCASESADSLRTRYSPS